MNKRLNWDEKGPQEITYDIDLVKKDLEEMSGKELWECYRSSIDVVTTKGNHPKVMAREIMIWHYAGEEIKKRLEKLDQ